MSSLIKTAKKLFVDSIKLHVKGGTGGTGLPQYGGIGGKGGDVYIKGTSSDKATLKSVQKKCVGHFIKAQDGRDARRTKLLGESGEDLVIKVPLGVTIEDDNKQIIGEINTPKDNVLVVYGGRGGDKFNDNHGFAGQSKIIRLDYKLISDAVFVGFPNAGKSSLLRAVSNAVPKVANYPFTTLKPHLGVVNFDDYRRVTMADLPGLVEGAHRNLGLGHEFLKHIVRARILVFVVDINNVDLGPDYPNRTPLETLCILNKEIELYDDTIIDKPSILAISKMDSLDDAQERFDKLNKDLVNFHKNPKTSELISDSLRPERVIQFDAIIPISSVSNYNIRKFKHLVRKVIDDYAEKDKYKRDKFTTYKEIQPLETNRLMQ